jgi:succinate-semialdehyde dehydrogenase/glutarate-semialdehyde dehydrogenase
MLTASADRPRPSAIDEPSKPRKIPMYPDIQLFIDGEWTAASNGKTLDVLNPATGEVIGKVAQASTADLQRAVEAADRGFKIWRETPAHERYLILRQAATLLRERVDHVARLLTLEQGKLLREAKIEVLGSAEIIDWMAEEGRRAYGRIIPGRIRGVHQMVLKEPVGPVAAFTPWNFPISQAVRKIAAALTTGCSIVIKPPEDTPASPAELVRCFIDAGVPAGVINMVYGVPSEVSEYLIPHPVIRKISFTGSVPVGKHLAALAGKHMKRATMELGGHGPAMIFNDADVENAGKLLIAAKTRNAGQVCVSPTRFMVEDGVYEDFLGRFVSAAKAVKVGDGLDEATGMGPVVNSRRLEALEALIADAVQQGAKVECGGARVGNKGNFLAPTVLTNLNNDMRIMNEEPFGPIALFVPFSGVDAAIEEANRLPYGLAAYAFTRDAAKQAQLSERLEVGMVTINHIGLAVPESPFGGVKDSGHGAEGGIEGVEAYLNTKFVTQVNP